jgi:nitrogen fixation/metabolism regulation signal transduction histidine kinase
MVGVAADITDRKQAEEAIQQVNRKLADLNWTLEERVKARTLELEEVIRQVNNEKEKTERIIDEITDGVIVTDVTGKIILINPAAQMLLEMAGLFLPLSGSRIPYLQEILGPCRPRQGRSQDPSLLSPGTQGHGRTAEG